MLPNHFRGARGRFTRSPAGKVERSHKAKPIHSPYNTTPYSSLAVPQLSETHEKNVNCLIYQPLPVELPKLSNYASWVDISARAKAVIALRGCKFLTGTEDDIAFCNKPKQPGKPYCMEHYRVCYSAVGTALPSPSSGATPNSLDATP